MNMGRLNNSGYAGEKYRGHRDEVECTAGASPVRPARAPGSVDEQVLKLEGALIHLEKVAEELEMRLAPVLRERFPTPLNAAEAEPTAVPTCSLASQLESHYLHARRLTASVESMAERLGL